MWKAQWLPSRDYSMTKGIKHSFTVEKSDKYYCSLKVKINCDKTHDKMLPYYDFMKMAFTSIGFLTKTQPSLTMKKQTPNSNRVSFYKTYDPHSLKQLSSKTTKIWETIIDQMGLEDTTIKCNECGILNGILEQKKDTLLRKSE